jgi:hypothetical protein
MKVVITWQQCLTEKLKPSEECLGCRGLKVVITWQQSLAEKLKASEERLGSR